MRDFSTARRAKEYLIGEIEKAAEREGVALSEIERKMLYFSESGWTLPNMLEVNEQFEREYDNNDYERKIVTLIRGMLTRPNRAQDEIEDWDSAVGKLASEDHYLLVLIESAGGQRKGFNSWHNWLPSMNSSASRRPQGDFIRLVLAATMVIAVALLLALFRVIRFR
jgi:hypothetical protein